MTIRLLMRIFKCIFRASVPIVGIVCLVNYWKADLIVDKIHYGIFMIAMLIIAIGNNNNNRGGIMCTS